MTQQQRAEGPTAIIQISIYPCGIPGKVLTEIATAGPAQLTDPEVVKFLRQAADSIEEKD